MHYSPTTPTFKHLMRVHIRAAPPIIIGLGPLGDRKLVAITGGEFRGDKLGGKVLSGGGDWLLQRSDDCAQLDARYTLETDDGALIYLQDQGYRHGPESVMVRLAQGETVDPGDYYFRTSARLETATENYAWLNKTVVVGSGMRGPEGVTIDFYTVE